MQRIEQKFIDKGSEKDIFTYYRSFYEVDNPNESNIITINASSTTTEPGENRSDVSVLISKRRYLRWVSREEDDYPYITIDFHSTYIDLLHYTFETDKISRYNKAWKIFGIRGNREILIDYKDDPLCPETGCKSYTYKTFTCRHPGAFTKFKIQAASEDSLCDKMLSFSGIQFFGVVHPSLPLFTCKHQKQSYNKIILIITLLLFH